MFGAPQTSPIWDGKLICRCCMCLMASWTGHSPISLLLHLPYSLRHNIKIGPINNPTTNECSSERKSCTSPTLNRKLEIISLVRLPRWLSGDEPACQFRRGKRCGFYPWVGKIPWSRNWQLTPVLFPGKFHGQRPWQATVHGIASIRHD